MQTIAAAVISLNKVHKTHHIPLMKWWLSCFAVQIFFGTKCTPKLYAKKEKKLLYCITYSRHCWSLSSRFNTITNDSRSNLIIFVQQWVNLGTYRSLCQSVPYDQWKRSITVACPRMLYHRLTFLLDVPGNPQKPHPKCHVFPHSAWAPRLWSIYCVPCLDWFSMCYILLI